MTGVTPRHTTEQAFAERLRACRERAGFRQAEAAERLGVSRSTVSAWEQGAREPGIGALARLAALYGVSVGDLFLAVSESSSEPAGVRLSRLERVVRQIRDEVDNVHRELRRDGLVSA